VILANNETGVINPIGEVVEIAHSHGAAVHSDTSQAVGKVEVDFGELGVDFASVSGHKMYGPKGTGAMYIRDTRHFSPLLHGGGQERGLRAGTVNVPGVVGLGHAATLADPKVGREGLLVQRLWQQLRSGVLPVEWNGSSSDRLPNTLNVRFAGADAEAVLAHAPELAISTGSACTSSVPTPSHVLLAMGMSSEAAEECIRVSVGRPTTEAEVDAAAEILRRSVAIVRELAGAPHSELIGERAVSK
jgi:cysteine desulfurase